MSKPIEVDLPHQLGRAEVRRRIDGGFGKLSKHIPGGSITEQGWDGDTLNFVVEAVGQRVTAKLDVADTNVHCTFELPGFLSLFSNKIKTKLIEEGPKLLK